MTRSPAVRICLIVLWVLALGATEGCLRLHRTAHPQRFESVQAARAAILGDCEVLYVVDGRVQSDSVAAYALPTARVRFVELAYGTGRQVCPVLQVHTK